MIVTDLKKLNVPVQRTEFNEVEEKAAAATLFTYLKKHGGLGLSANQIGLDKRICVINVKEPIYLVNPIIVETSEKRITYIEGCLSLPKTKKKPKKTVRYEWVKVKADNYDSELLFDGDFSEQEWQEGKFWDDEGLLESVVVQHEIDHLDGITIKDRTYQEPSKKIHKISRNQKVIVQNPETSDMEFMKYKHAQKLEEIGWKIKA